MADKFIQKLIGDWGQYPKAYDARVHGPYDPARFYGKPDTAYGDLKIAEVPGWLARRNKTPRAMAGAISRAYWRWQHKYVNPKRSGIAPIIQVCVASMVFFYVINYGKMIKHRNYKYHW